MNIENKNSVYSLETSHSVTKNVLTDGRFMSADGRFRSADGRFRSADGRFRSVCNGKKFRY